MVRLTHKMAIECDLIVADAIEAIEFPDLAIRYQVRGVPLTIANETVRVEGLVPEGRLVKEILDRFK